MNFKIRRRYGRLKGVKMDSIAQIFWIKIEDPKAATHPQLNSNFKEEFQKSFSLENHFSKNYTKNGGKIENTPKITTKESSENPPPPIMINVSSKIKIIQKIPQISENLKSRFSHSNFFSKKTFPYFFKPIFIVFGKSFEYEKIKGKKFTF